MKFYFHASVRDVIVKHLTTSFILRFSFLQLAPWWWWYSEDWCSLSFYEWWGQLQLEVCASPGVPANREGDGCQEKGTLLQSDKDGETSSSNSHRANLGQWSILSWWLPRYWSWNACTQCCQYQCFHTIICSNLRNLQCLENFRLFSSLIIIKVMFLCHYLDTIFIHRNYWFQFECHASTC